MSRETQLFPRSTDWKRARLIQLDGKLYVQSRWNEEKQCFESTEGPYNADDDVQKLEAYVLYSDLQASGVINKLYGRENVKQFFKKLQEAETQ